MEWNVNYRINFLLGNNEIKNRAILGYSCLLIIICPTIHSVKFQCQNFKNICIPLYKVYFLSLNTPDSWHSQLWRCKQEISDKCSIACDPRVCANSLSTTCLHDEGPSLLMTVDPLAQITCCSHGPSQNTVNYVPRA